MSFREDITKILKALKEGNRTRNELLELTHIKPTRLHTRLNFLLKRGDIEGSHDPEDRRITLYRISKNKSKEVMVQLRWAALEGFLLRLKQKGFDPEKFLENNFISFIEGVPYFFPKKAVEIETVENAMKELAQRAKEEGLSVPEYMRNIVQKAFEKRGIK